MMGKRSLSSGQIEDMIRKLRERYDANTSMHDEIEWAEVEKRLRGNPEKLWSLNEMERTGGEPGVVDLDEKTGEFIFMDRSPESPKGRRSVCYDPAALESRKEHKPAHSAKGMAREMGIEVLNEEQYRRLQSLRPIDTKTSSWIDTPDDIRERGGALFGDWRYGHVFIYHNGAESYYAARGFRGLLRV